ncbi:MAG: adenylosuccinate synthase [Candidatus Ancaeobacter aquaticus]|nr:adenylosuccinate synthase [Candidatus Ancaeobacter aquaticus]
MPNLVLVGAQWGDEGKGKIIDVLTEKADVVIRFQGGNNAGHTVKIGTEEFILHLIPSGILHKGKICMIGNGVVVDPLALLQEIEELATKGISIDNNLFVSETCHIIFPYHRKLDLVKEEKMGSLRIGTTGRGIGPAYMDKFSRVGIRLCDLLNKDVFKRKLEANLEEKNLVLQKVYGEEPISFDEIFETYTDYAQKLRKYSANTSLLLNRAIKEGKNILFEGAQGTLLDVDFGTYPFVTSSNPTAGGACTGTGVGPTSIDNVIGIAKAYTTRVGEGPFPTEFPEDLAAKIRKEGLEYGATTQRPRRCGWFDAVIVRHAVSVNGCDSLAVTKMDVLDKLPVIKICTGYKYKGEMIYDFPLNIDVLHESEPVYEECEGWQTSTNEVKRYEDLPVNAQKYLARIEKLAGVKIKIISVGAERGETLLLDSVF